MTQSEHELLYSQQEDMNPIDQVYANLKENWIDSAQDLQTLDLIVIPVFSTLIIRT